MKVLPKFKDPFEMLDFFINDNVRIYLNLELKSGQSLTECVYISRGKEWLHISLMPVGYGHWIRIDSLESISVHAQSR